MPSNTPQGMLYQMRGQNTAPSDGNGSRNRVAEQQNSAASGNPYNYRGNSNMDWNQFLNGQSQNLGRYTPPTLSSMSPTSPQWNNNPGGYAYNLPTSFGGFGGFSQYEMPQQGQGQGTQMGTPMQGGIRQNPFNPGQRTNPYQDSKQDPNKSRWDELLSSLSTKMPAQDTTMPTQRQAPQPMPYTPPRGSPLTTSSSSGAIDYPYIPPAVM